MSAPAEDRDIKIIAGGDIDPFFQRNVTGRTGRENVQTEDLLDIVNHAFLHQFARAARRHFFGRLEDKLDAAAQLAAQVAKQFRRAHQHGGVGIVTAGVHYAGFG